nr:MAG TPA: hypothetical protein [Caudoviricetes sp.]
MRPSFTMLLKHAIKVTFIDMCLVFFVIYSLPQMVLWFIRIFSGIIHFFWFLPENLVTIIEFTKLFFS